LIEVTIPALTTEMPKETLDGLQLWADDLAQWAEGGFAPKSSFSAATSTAPTSVTGSTTTSRAQSMMIGSRYFVPRTASTVGKDETTVAPSELLIQLNIDNGKQGFHYALRRVSKRNN
jgi:autophagy-related protein 2